jgi:Na+-driven multidrug efflux pump
MLLLDGWGGDKWGGRGLAGVEAVVGGFGALILLVYFLTEKRRNVPADEAAVEA